MPLGLNLVTKLAKCGRKPHLLGNSIGGGIRKYDELNEGERGTVYIAAWIMCRLVGWGPRRIRRKLVELYSVEVPFSTLNHWLYKRGKPRFRPRTFEKSLFYHKAYEMALGLKEEHPDWGYKRITAELSKMLPIRVPAITVYFWVTGRSRPNVTPLKLARETLPYIAYCFGVGCGDYRRTVGSLRAKDRVFVERYAEAYERCTGVRIRVGPCRSGEGFWETYERGGWLRSGLRIGVWKVFAELDPVNWLRGLFDSEGNSSPHLMHSKRVLYGMVISLTTGNLEVKEFAKRKLEELGFRVRDRYDNGEVRAIKGIKYRFGGRWKLYIWRWDDAKLFQKLIGFRESRKMKMLEDLLKLRQLPPTERYELWIEMYYKAPNGRWRSR
ncbi:MAG: hypothetical protein DRK00_10160 [Thermoprotei archaeon]|nr:MAG: hypothetical protein DRK00_10160 [Thermoprotei archaeon]